ncbi:MAG: 2-oxoacid:ferredoxin oxidoreductase subunit beta, partial [Novosphingobium sp.]
MLEQKPFGPFPIALGENYDEPRPSYEEVLLGQDEQARKGKDANLAKLLGKGQTWTVSGTAADPV